MALGLKSGKATVLSWRTMLMASVGEEVRNENLDPNRVFYKKLIHAFYQNHPRRKPQTLEDIDQIKLDKINNFYMDRFADSSDFVFTFVGDFSIDEMKPYIATPTSIQMIAINIG